MDKVYLEDLDELKKLADNIPDTPMMAIGKIAALITLNMRYERIMLNRDLKSHPYNLVSGFIQDSGTMMSAWKEAGFIENPSKKAMKGKGLGLEGNHRDLFQKLWINFSADEYKERIGRYKYRLEINGLGKGWLSGFRCIDFGCGHGNFAHALVQEGAHYVYGIDYGEDSIRYAIDARNKLGIKNDRIEFEVGSVYTVPRKDCEFDFAVQNGVFHHLEDEDAAIREMNRVLKVGGKAWYYTDGAGGISHDLWDASRYMLRNIPEETIIAYLKQLNIETGKRYHLGDGLNAVYRHTTWDEITKRLTCLGFSNFRRLVGGFDTDFDHDVIAKDRYGHEKFGDGDLRILAEKVKSV